MYASIWSYPWDLEDLGIACTLKDMKEHNLTGVSLITSYHAGRFLQIRSGKRKVYFPEDGVLYYPSDLSRFKGQRIQPQIGRFIQEHPGFWDEVFNEAAKLNMTVSGWTVCLHNTRIGMAYEDTCVHNAYDDPIYYNQCPSNSDVRLYMNTLIDDICSTLPWHSLELESMNYMGHAHEYHHEKDGIGLTKLDDFLFSLCFCDSCVKRAKSEGLDILPAKKTLRMWLDQICLRDVPHNRDEEFLQRGFAFFQDTPEVYDYLQWRSTVVTSLVQEVVYAASGYGRLYFLSLLPHSRSWLFGVDLKSISGICNGVVVCSYDCDAWQAAADMRESRKDFGDHAELLIGMRAFCPEYSGQKNFKEKVRLAKEQGVNGYLFYNYGLIPPAHLDWIKDALDELRGK
jgi:hypothetical protein